MKCMNRTEFIAGLNEDPAHEDASVIRYRTFASVVGGPDRPTLRALFASGIADEFEHVGPLAGAIVALGGGPTVVPGPVPLVVGRSDAVRIPARKGAQPAPAGYGGDT